MIGRFINSDFFLTTDTNSFLNFNMFAYCENNPINKADYGGNISTTNVMMYDGGGGSVGPVPIWAKKILSGKGTENDYNQAVNCRSKELPKHVEKAIELAHDYYRRIGRTGVRGVVVSACGGLGAVGSISVGYLKDSFGNIAVIVSPGWGGGGGLNIKINAYGLAGSSVSFPDAVTVWDLAGWGASLGGTLGALEYESLQSVGPSPTIHGHSVGIGAGLEFHSTITYSWLIPLN